MESPDTTETLPFTLDVHGTKWHPVRINDPEKSWPIPPSRFVSQRMFPRPEMQPSVFADPGLDGVRVEVKDDHWTCRMGCRRRDSFPTRCIMAVWDWMVKP